MVVIASCHTKQDQTTGEIQCLPECHVHDLPRLRELCSDLNLDIIKELTATKPWGPKASDIAREFGELSHQDLSAYDALVVIIATHGSDGAIYGWPEQLADGRAGSASLSGPVNLQEVVIAPFQPPGQGGEWSLAAQTLLGKPKVFIIDACRSLPTNVDTSFSVTLRGDGHSVFEGLPQCRKYDILRARHQLSGEATTRLSDILVAYSTVGLNSAGMLPSEGSNYLSSLVEVAKRRSEGGSFVGILENVNDRMQQLHSGGSRSAPDLKVMVHGYPQCATFTSQLRCELDVAHWG